MISHCIVFANFQEEFEDAYQAALAAEEDPNAPLDPDAPTDPLKVKVVRWVMDNTLCGWLIGKGGSGIQNIEVRLCLDRVMACV